MAIARLLLKERVQVWFPIWVVVLMVLHVHPARLSMVGALQVGYYQLHGCPDAEKIVRGAMENAVQQNRGIAAGVLRLHFHDCFVQGCDGSVLLDGPGSEKTAIPNLSLRGWEAVDAAKADLEAQCAGVVSCADVLAFAARDAVELTGGLGWPVPAGRLDGRVSIAAEATANIPNPTFNVNQLTENFARKGFSQQDMITLSGAHTIGQTHCASVTNRLYPAQDPTLDAGLAAQLKSMCPEQVTGAGAAFPLDSATPGQFDNKYYSNLFNNKGVLTSDQVLFSDFATRGATIFNSFAAGSWEAQFSRAMVQMSQIEVKTGPDGEIRRNCRSVN